jgi:formyl-CoA transferase
MSITNDWYKMTGIPIKFSRTPGQIRRLPPKFSEHSKEILAGIGIQDESFERLVKEGVVPLLRR